MHIKYSWIILTTLSLVGVLSCSKKIKKIEDKIYSRHLQTHIPLSIISTPLPDDTKNINLLLLNDGQDIEQLNVVKTVDSLYKATAIEPIIIVAIHSIDRMQTYGVAGIPDFNKRGSKADKYEQFIFNELLPFVKKQSGVRKFNSIAIAGCSLGGLSAMDIAWNHADKINKVGVFSGSFWWRDIDITDTAYSDSKNRILLSKIKTSRKRPKLNYWLYAGNKEEISDRDKDGIIDVVDDTKDLIEIIQNKKLTTTGEIVFKQSEDGKHDYNSWRKYFPEFMVWAFGK